jgi:CBS domain-containing protein
MKVKEVMTANPETCALTDSLAKAAGLMWEKDCGILPVVSDEGAVVGLLTDRDICMAAALKGRELANIGVEDTITGQVFTCEPNDEIRTALNTMQKNKVRRLPVLAADGTLEGLLSMNDIVLKVEDSKAKKVPGLSYIDVVNAYKSICQHRVPTQQAQAATGN